MMDGSQPQGKPMRRATIKDVAEKAKVSLKTVSRVINNEPSVMQATRARVLRAIAELDYEPDPSARNLRSGTTFVIGLVYDNPNPYHIIGVQNGVLAACRETGFGLQIHPCDSSSPLLADELADWVQRAMNLLIAFLQPLLDFLAKVGTLIVDNVNGEIIADLTEHGQTELLAKGGEGGWGNIHFKTSTNRAPRSAV